MRPLALWGFAAFAMTAVARDVPIPFLLGPRNIGVVKFNPEGATATFSRPDILNCLSPSLKAEEVDKVARLPPETQDYLSLAQLNQGAIQFHFDESLLQLTADIDASQKENLVFDFKKERSAARTTDVKIEPSPYSGYLNVYTAVNQEPNSFRSAQNEAELRMVHNLYGWAWINDTDRREPAGHFVRRRSLLLKDWSARRLRFQAGDVQSASVASQSAYSLLGAGLSKNFLADPLDTFQASASREILLRSPSQVDVFVNGRKVDSFFSREGPLQLKNLPVTNGANAVELVVTDKIGQTERHLFNVLYDATLLGRGVTDYSFFIGRPSRNEGEGLRYERNDWLWSGNFRRGHWDELTHGIYASASRHKQFAGTQITTVTLPGTFGLDYAYSQFPASHLRGSDVKVFYESPRQFFRRSLDFTLRASAEFIGKYYFSDVLATYDANTPQAYSHLQSASVTQSFFDLVHTTLGLAFAQHRSNSLENSRVYFLNTSLHFAESWNLLLNTQLQNTTQAWKSSFFLSLSWQGSRKRASVSYDSLPKSAKAALDYESENPYQGFRLGADVDRRPRDSQVQASAQYTHPRFEAGTRQNIQKTSGVSRLESTANYRAASALVWTSRSLALSRPVTNSFAIIRSDAKTEGAKSSIPINMSAEGAEAHFRPYWPGSISQLDAYRNRFVMLDSTSLPLGTRLDPHLFTLAPTPYSGLDVNVSTLRHLYIKGRLVNAQNEAWDLKQGKLKAAGQAFGFFTNRKGVFFIEDTPATEMELEIEVDGELKRLPIKVPADQEGMYDAGTITIPL